MRLLFSLILTGEYYAILDILKEPNMSRTTKDKPSKLKFDYDTDRVMTENWRYRQLPTTKPKKRKELDTEDHWRSTPSWWTKMTMIRPERRAAHLLEKKSLRVVDIEDMDFPDLGKKPHCYYW